MYLSEIIDRGGQLYCLPKEDLECLRSGQFSLFRAKAAAHPELDYVMVQTYPTGATRKVGVSYRGYKCDLFFPYELGEQVFPDNIKDIGALMDSVKPQESQQSLAAAVEEKPKTERPVGLRNNKGKIDLTQLSPVAQIIESLVFMYGAIKYARNNWKFFKKTEQEANDEYLTCLKRHLMALERGEWFDQESKLPHVGHLVWNANRMLDVYYYGLTHMQDGKDLFHQPLRHELPTIPTVENFKELYGIEPGCIRLAKEEKK
jgi:hypothetical protein